MVKILITRRIPAQAISLLKEQNYQLIQHDENSTMSRAKLLENIADVDGLFCLLTDKIDRQFLDQAQKLRVIATMSVGYDHIDIPACKERKIKLGYTPDVLTEATAELTMALLLSTSRKLPAAQEAVRSGAWGTWSPLWMCGKGIQNSIVGIFGFGRIGRSVANKIASFQPAKIIYTTSRSGRRTEMINNVQVEQVGFNDLVSKSDFLIICAALNAQTTCIFNADSFKHMKNDAIIVNTSRGGLIDQDALYVALSTSQIGAAGLDVCTPEPMATNDRLLSLENCVILPHIGSATVEARTAMAMLTSRNIIAALNDQKMPAEIL